MESIIQIIVGIVIAGAIIVMTKKESSKSLLFVLFFMGLISYDLYNFTHHPRNMYLIAIAQGTGTNYMISVIDLIANSKGWYNWLVYLIFIPYFSYSFFKNKQKEDAVLNAVMLLINRGEIKINLDIISNQINVNNNDISDLFDIFKSSGKIPYDVETYTEN